MYDFETLFDDDNTTIKNFLSLFDDSNSTIDKTKKEITITVPIISQNSSKLIISSPWVIKSTCNTKIEFIQLEINSKNVSLSGLQLDGIVLINKSRGVQITNCVFPNTKEMINSILIDYSNVRLKKVEIYGNANIGINSSDQSKVEVEDSKIHDLRETLIVVRGSVFLIHNSEISNSKANGFFVNDSPKFKVENCKIFNTKYPSICTSSSRCIIKGNEFRNCKQNTVSIESSTDFVFTENLVTQGSSTGLSIEQSTGSIFKNTFSDLDGNGILCSIGSNMKIYNNQFTNNNYPSIVLQTKSKAIIESNIIEKNSINGISLRNAAGAQIENNKIDDVNECGISISDSEEITIKNNVIQNCKITGIESYNKSNVFITNNVIKNIGKYAFLSYTSGYIKAVENTIDDVKLSMAKIAFKGSGDFLNNNITNCPRQCECLTTSFYFFNDNKGFENITNDPKRSSSTIKLDEEKFDDSSNNKLCLKCKVKPINCFILQCGHRIYCKECAELALENKEVCPLCRFPIEGVSKGFNASDDDTCIICMTNKEDCIIMPCGHMGVCSTCMESWLKNNKSCPICRAEPCFYKLTYNNEI